MKKHVLAGLALLGATFIGGCGPEPDGAGSPPDFSRAVTTERLANAASEPNNWLTHGGTYLEQRHSPLTEISKDTLEPPRAGVVLRIRHLSRPGSDAARRRRRAVHDERLEQGVRAERRDRRADLELRPEGARRRGCESLLRRELARACAVRGQADHRDARRPAHRARPNDGRGGLEHRHRRSNEDVHDHGRAARREGQGRHRQRRRRVRRARLRQRLRRRHRRARVALLRRARRSRGGSRRRGLGQGARRDRGADVVRPLVRDGRRRHAVGRDRLRRRARSALRRHRQRQPLESPDSLRRQGRQLVPRERARARPRHRRVRLALPGSAGRVVGLHVDAADDPRRLAARRRRSARSSCTRRRTASSTCSIGARARSSRRTTSCRRTGRRTSISKPAALRSCRTRTTTPARSSARRRAWARTTGRRCRTTRSRGSSTSARRAPR